MTIYDGLWHVKLRRKFWPNFDSTEFCSSIVVASAAAIALLVATFWVWLDMGTTIFFETIRTGFSLCG